MKNITKYISLIALLACGVFSSCLKEDASPIVNPNNFFKNANQIRGALNGCYDPLNKFHNLQYFIAVEGSTDIASCNGSATRDARLEINPASPGCGTAVWQYCYYGIRYCYSTLAGIDRSPLPEEEKAPFRAEAWIVASYYWYVLTSFFGDVPYYEEYVKDEDTMSAVASIGRIPASVARKSLIAHLRISAAVLPQVRSCDIPMNYAGAAMGWMMIAKLAAWEEDWTTVIDACEHLESIYGSLGQYSYQDVWFRNKNTGESIFEIQHAYVEGGVNYTTPNSLSVASVVMPYPKTAGADIYDSVTIPDIGNSATCYTPLRPTSYMKNDVWPASAEDDRRESNMCSGWGGVSFPSSRVWMGPKFWCPGMYQNRDNNNYKILRYADALLLMAEALNELGYDQQSVEYLNKVRARANAEPYVFVSHIKLRGEIRNERARELFGEFGRKFDLVRWGIWYDQVKAYNLYNLVQENIRPCHEYYPIPDQQCQVSGGVLKNPEYEKYNLNN